MRNLLFTICLLASFLSKAQTFVPSQMKELLYGVAYYYEYMPYERLEEDARMMKAAGINLVRICESTWAYMEPQDGVFNFDYVGRVLDVMHKNGIKVIVGTPTYAFPSWLARKYPDILVVEKNGQRPYGTRQIMDITNKNYLFHSERIIRKLIDYVHKHPAVIGYQIDNETKHFDTEGPNVQEQFKKHLQRKFKTPMEMNQAFGLHYWSNSVFNWDDMPSTVGTINGSLRCELEIFQRKLVNEFLAWQIAIVNEYKRPDQFTTQNFDLEFRNMSFGIQQRVDHFEACKPFDISGIDIYHATGDELDGVQIGFGGDIARSMKNTNYLVMETQAQSILPSHDQRLPFPNQLRLQAFSHIASGANMVAYWPWHSIHNSVETYWKGLLSHDLEPNPTYNEAMQIGAEFKKIGSNIMNLKKTNKVAIYFSNESLTALKHFPYHAKLNYNDFLHRFYELLFKLNIECDFIDHSSTDIEKYKVIVVPALYVASDEELNRLTKFAENGGQVIYGFKSGFCNENVQARTERQPGIIRKSAGVSYQQGVSIPKLPIAQTHFNVDTAANYVYHWAELLVPEGAEVLANYVHPYWGKYAAIVRNSYGKGKVTYLGTWPSDAILENVIMQAVNAAGIPKPEFKFPVIVRNGVNSANKNIHYIFNYSSIEKNIKYSFNDGVDLLTNSKALTGNSLIIKPWDLVIVEEK